MPKRLETESWQTTPTQEIHISNTDRLKDGATVTGPIVSARISQGELILTDRLGSPYSGVRSRSERYKLTLRKPDGTEEYIFMDPIKARIFTAIAAGRGDAVSSEDIARFTFPGKEFPKGGAVRRIQPQVSRLRGLLREISPELGDPMSAEGLIKTITTQGYAFRPGLPETSEI